MGSKITVTTRPGNRISINSPQRQQIKSVNTVGGAGADRLAELVDVDATSVDNNETIVYDEGSGKFVVKEIPIINGGTF